MHAYTVRQLNILSDHLQKFEDGNIPLDSLVKIIESVLAVLEDAVFAEKIFPYLVALEEINACSQEKNFDFPKYGKPIVRKAINAIQEILQNKLLDLSRR